MKALIQYSLPKYKKAFDAQLRNILCFLPPSLFRFMPGHWYLKFEGSVTLCLWGMSTVLSARYLVRWWRRLNLASLTIAGNGFVPILSTRGWWGQSWRPDRPQEDCSEVIICNGNWVNDQTASDWTEKVCIWIALLALFMNRGGCT